MEDLTESLDQLSQDADKLDEVAKMLAQAGKGEGQSVELTTSLFGMLTGMLVSHNKLLVAVTKRVVEIERHVGMRK